jgi:hypothetical protein
MNKKITLLATVLYFFISTAIAQISITNTTPYTQNFNGLPNTGAPTATNPNPADWYRHAATTGATSLTVGYGSLNTGGFYSAGDTAVATRSDRALGSLLSSGAKPLYFGAKFVNNTGSSIVSATVSYKCEQWRRGNNNAGLKDTLLLDYATGTDSVHLGSWTNVPSLTGSSTNSTTTTGALDGNAVFANVSGSITGMAIPNGATFWIRFNDYDVSPGSDDLLAVDDFSISFTTGTVTACTEPAASVTNVVLNQTGITSVAGSFTGTTPASDGYLVLLDSTAAVPVITDATSYTVGQTVGSAVVISNSASTTFTKSGLVGNTTYKVYVYPYNNASCSGGPNYKISSPGNDTAKTLIDACPEPVNSVTNLVFTNVTNTTITGKFKKSAGAAGYVVLYSTSTTLPAVRDSADYSVGQTVTQGANTATVGYFGTDSNFTLTALTAGTKYYAVVFPYTTCPFGKNYKISFTNDVNKQDTTTLGGIVPCNAPDTILAISVGTVTTSSISGSFTPPTTGADGYIVLYRKGAFLVAPRDSVTYTVGNIITAVSGTFFDTSYVGAILGSAATTFTLSGLDNNTRYYFSVLPYKTCPGGPNYNTKISFASNKTSATTGAAVSCPAPDTITGVTVGTVTGTTISGTFGIPASGASGYIVIYRKSSFLATPSDSITYTLGQVITKVSGLFIDSATVGFIGTNGLNNAFTITGLSPLTKYYFAVIPYNTCSYGPNYNLKIGGSTTTNSNRGIATTTVGTGVKNKNSEVDFAIYPNPTNTGSVFVKFNNYLKEEAVIEVIDILGQKLSAQKIFTGNNLQNIDVSNFAKGTYILNVVYKGENNVSTFIVQ